MSFNFINFLCSLCCCLSVVSNVFGEGFMEKVAYEINDEYKSKSFDERIKFLVIHYTVGDFDRALKELTQGNVSAHYLIPKGSDPKRSGIVYRLVDENLRAWTEGVSFWGERTNINDSAIGIEIVNSGNKFDPDFEPFDEAQVQVILSICKDIVDRNEIKPIFVLGHSDVSPGRKIDPGPRFPWKQLYDNGVGAWPNMEDVNYYLEKLPECCDIKEMQEDLRKYGYHVNVDGEFTEQTKAVLAAFQMHFNPKKHDGNPDKETWSILKALIYKYTE